MMTPDIILVVEDNPLMREALSDILSLEGYRVLAAQDGSHALQLLHKETPDLILSDISMPEMDGFTFFNEVRQQTEWITIPFIFLTARSEREDLMTGRILGAEDYLVKPLTREELLTAIRSRLERSRQLQVAQLHQAYQASLSVLANAIDLRDRYTRGHVERVTAYAVLIASYLGWTERQLEQLRFGAILHDIGKIHIPEKALFKPDRLDDNEWMEVRRHSEIGADMIRDISYLAEAEPVVRYHHERWDGSGYPEGLVGEQIPLSARIVAVADGFDAMTTRRPYSNARDLEQAYQEILASAGTQYDPAVVAAFQLAWEAKRVEQIAAEWFSAPDETGKGK